MPRDGNVFFFGWGGRHPRVELALSAWKSLRESYPQLGEAKKPTFLKGVRKRGLSAGYGSLAGFGALVLVISVLALLADDLAIGTTRQPWVSAGVGGAALLVSGLEYLWSEHAHAGQLRQQRRHTEAAQPLDWRGRARASCGLLRTVFRKTAR